MIAETPVDAMPKVIANAKAAFEAWRTVPAPRRGELVRLLGEELRAAKDELGALVTLEAGKIVSEGLGEVQEMIDICDLAVGQSRQLYGLTIASERPGHSMSETWHPIGPVGVISAFNFPVAVWCWNTALAIVCGNPVIWKPSEKSPLTALACQKIFERAMARFGDAPAHLSQVVIGKADVGAALVESRDVPVISATGSTRMGNIVGPKVAARWGRPILELGGNNAMIVAPTADLEMAVRAIVFSAVGTAGQRCTSLRRLIVHKSIKDDLVAKLKKAYASLPIGDPRVDGTLIGPLVDQAAGDAMKSALAKANAEGGQVFGGDAVEAVAGGVYMQPALVEMPGQTETVKNRDLRANPLCDGIRGFRRGHCDAKRRAAGSVLLCLHHGCARGQQVCLCSRVRLRHCQCEYRPVRRGNRRCIWRRKGNRRRSRKRVRCLERLYAPPDLHGELLC